MYLRDITTLYRVDTGRNDRREITAGDNSRQDRLERRRNRDLIGRSWRRAEHVLFR